MKMKVIKINNMIQQIIKQLIILIIKLIALK